MNEAAIFTNEGRNNAKMTIFQDLNQTRLALDWETQQNHLICLVCLTNENSNDLNISKINHFKLKTQIFH